ncbi:class A beta-lactamase-related serine hydrolase [Sphingomonas sp. G124]|uniref:beta-lactamase n=1 Tax=Sphingomonas cremea TaxID=2904799 RepID=A0A9X1QLK1_9SPHN|nr:serine hydrolase [Sphingomonas cremea]MCF2514926.1 class A beta-lactamase-related serine hydrolase [Sphingomonas cremea]
MTSHLCRFLTGAGLVALTALAHGQPSNGDPLAPLPPDTSKPQSTVQQPALRQLPPRIAPAALRDRITSLGRSFNGIAGISVVSMTDGWQADYNATTLFPQQSCSKLWVAITAMDAVDKGRISLNDRVTLRRDDLTLFHQPISTKILGGGHTTTLGSLLFTAITESDNTANDKLMRSVGGPQAVRDMIAAKGLGSIRFYEGERALQSKIAGLIWSQSYSIGDAFYKARGALPASVRRASFERYIADPYDGAAPHSVALALARLKKGELLSPASTQRLLATMGSTKTGALRVRAALKPGWKWSHKTGTGQDFQGRVGGINDIGILTAPDGTTYTMAIMTVPNKADGASQDLMQAVTRAVMASHEARRTL